MKIILAFAILFIVAFVVGGFLDLIIPGLNATEFLITVLQNLWLFFNL